MNWVPLSTSSNRNLVSLFEYIKNYLDLNIGYHKAHGS